MSEPQQQSREAGEEGSKWTVLSEAEILQARLDERDALTRFVNNTTNLSVDDVNAVARFVERFLLSGSPEREELLIAKRRLMELQLRYDSLLDAAEQKVMDDTLVFEVITGRRTPCQRRANVPF